MKTFLSADHHLGHTNIIDLCKRPYKNVHDMNKDIIAKHNSRVGKNDLVIIDGDFCFKGKTNTGNGIDINWETYFKQLNGIIVLVKGNHDPKNGVNTPIESLTLYKGGIRIKVVHDPMYADPNYELNICGHVHNNWHFMSFVTYYERILNGIINDKRDNLKREFFIREWSKINKENSLIINVGVDKNQFYPYEFNEVMRIYQLWKNGKYGTKNI